jgi:serine/threonine-protein kinase
MSTDQYQADVSQIYQYKVDIILGQGGTGRVYRGLDPKTNQMVAVKLFRANFFRSKLHVKDLANGVKKFKKFDHRNIVKIYDFIDGKEGRCMIMEYIDGPDMKWYLTNRPWNLQERLSIFMQLCSGLQYLHDKGCIHHDFKPANVIFTRQGVAKILDFSLYGSSILLELFSGGVSEQITPMFVAPEYIRKERSTPSCDQYSLGVSMYMMFANRVPFPVDNIQMLYHCHLNVVPDHPSQVNPDCPRQVGDIILKLMSKTAKNRYKDCDEVIIQLSNLSISRI